VGLVFATIAVAETDLRTMAGAVGIVLASASSPS
jgi:hypothetical protein